MRRVGADGLVTTTATLTLETLFPIANLAWECAGQTIVSLDVGPTTPGMFQAGHSGAREGFHFTNIPNAAGLVPHAGMSA